MKLSLSKQKDSRGPSFETISASGPNAALAHYRYSVSTQGSACCLGRDPTLYLPNNHVFNHSPTTETNRKLNVDEMYLIDSGGQYL